MQLALCILHQLLAEQCKLSFVDKYMEIANKGDKNNHFDQLTWLLIFIKGNLEGTHRRLVSSHHVFKGSRLDDYDLRLSEFLSTTLNDSIAKNLSVTILKCTRIFHHAYNQ